MKATKVNSGLAESNGPTLDVVNPNFSLLPTWNGSLPSSTETPPAIIHVSLRAAIELMLLLLLLLVLLRPLFLLLLFLGRR